MGWPDPPLEPIRIIIKITRRSLWPWLHSISIRNPSLSSSGRSEIPSVSLASHCVWENPLPRQHHPAATFRLWIFASSPVCLSVCNCCSVFAFSLPLSPLLAGTSALTVLSKSQTPINLEVFLCLDPGIH